MTTYAIGDVQGCYDEMRYLLDRVRFDPASDTLWLVGDLVNKGPKSLQTLRFVKGLGKSAITVLGNHDLHFLSIAHGIRKPVARDTLKELLKAPDLDELVDWLRKRPLLHHDSKLGYTMVHAGIPPQWTLTQARALAREAEKKLAGKRYLKYLARMYGDMPDRWSNSLTGFDRFRVIINTFTRMRYCKPNGMLEFAHKENVVPRGYKPWFEHPRPAHSDMRIIFGHWASLNGQTGVANAIGLDTGCCWGRELTIMHLKSGRQLSCTSREVARALSN